MAKRYKLPVTKEISHGDVMDSMETIVNYTILHIFKLLREQMLKVLIIRKKSLYVW